jgi:3D (Asp-Asp-Asp) domain-containing protein
VTITFLVTAFCACVLCVGPRWLGAPTKAGTPPVVGRTLACDPKLLGAVLQLEVPAERPGAWSWKSGPMVCESTGSKVHGLHLDVFMRRHQEGVRFGRRRIQARVLHLPPGVDVVDGRVVRVR